MSDKKVEELLRQAPAPRAPADLLEKLEASIELPEQRRHQGPGDGRSRIRFWFPAASIAASAAALALLAVIVLSPAPVAYSFEKTVDAIRNTDGLHFVMKMRYGPAQTVEDKFGNKAATSFHPANPFATTEVYTQVINGRVMSRTSSTGSESISNGPLNLAIDRETGERHFFLSAPRFEPEKNPEAWFLELEEEAKQGGIDYEIKDKIDAAGNVEIVIRQRSGGVFNHKQDHEGEFQRIWVNAKTFLPVRFQIVSTLFPDFGAEVVMMEYEFLGFADFDEELFVIEPTEAELQKFGLTREDLAGLPPRATSIEVRGDGDTRFIGSIRDTRGTREIAGTFPLILVEDPEEVIYVDVWNENRERGRFEVVTGNFRLGTSGARIVVHSGDGDAFLTSGIPSDVEDIEAFINRNR